MTMRVSGRIPRRGRPPKGEARDTRAELLAAALKLFARNGYAGTSIRAIAREVGLSESVLYAHFASKRAIFEEVLAQFGPQSALASLVDTERGRLDADPPDLVRMLVADVMDAWDTPEARQLISMMSHDGLTHDAMLLASIETVLGTLAKIIERWMSDGLVDPHLGEPANLAYSLIAPIALSRLLWLHADATPEDRQTARDRATRHGEFFVRAVFQPRPPLT